MNALRSLTAPLFPPTPGQIRQSTQAVQLAISGEKAACLPLDRTVVGTTIIDGYSKSSAYTACCDRVDQATTSFLQAVKASSSLPRILFDRQVFQSIEGIKGTGTQIAAEIAPNVICTGKSDCGSCNSKKA